MKEHLMADSTHITVRQDTGGSIADLLTLDSVTDIPGNGASLSFVNNSDGEGLSLVLGRITASRVNGTTVRMDLAVPSSLETLGDATTPVLSLVGGSGYVGVRTNAPRSALDVVGSLMVSGNTDISSELRVQGNATLNTLQVSGMTTLDSGIQINGGTTTRTLNVSADAIFDRAMTVAGVASFGQLRVNGDATLSGALISNSLAVTAITASNIGVSGTLTVQGDTTLGSLNVKNAAILDNWLQVNGAASMSTLNIGSDAAFGGQIRVTGSASLGQLHVQGDAFIDGTLTSSNLTTTAIAANNIAAAGTLTVQGDTVLSSLTVRSYAIFENSLQINGGARLETLSVSTDANIGGRVVASGASFGQMHVIGDIDMQGALQLNNNMTCRGINVGNDALFNSQVTVVGTITAGSLSASTATISSGGLSVTGLSTLAGDTVITGKVGIGTATPADRLDVRGGVHLGQLTLTDAAGTPYPDTWIGMADTIDGTTKWLHIGGINDSGVRRIALYANITFISDRLGIRKTNPDPNFALDVGGSISTPSVVYPSDIRFKTNITQLTQVLERIDRIRGVSFDWDSSYAPGDQDLTRRQIGVIAQELEQVYPELITVAGNTDSMAVDYGKLGAILIEAIKELKGRVEWLEHSRA